MNPTTDQLKYLPGRAPDGHWHADYASGEINGSATGRLMEGKMGYTVKDFAFRMRNDVMVKGDRHKVADIIEQQDDELATLRAENERLREAFKNPDREVLRVVCYGTVCYADEFAEILESHWEALK